MAGTKRRDAGAGSVYRKHSPQYGCPPVSDGERAPHTCRDPYAASVELGWERGKRKRKVIVRKDKADVVAELKKLRATMDGGGTVATNIPTVEHYLTDWLDTVAANRVAPQTLRAYRSEVANHITPFIGKIRLDRLTPRHILELHKKLRGITARDGRPIAESSVLKAHAVLARALNDAVRVYRYIPTNPAKSIDRPKPRDKTERRELTADESLRVLRVVADDPDGSRWGAALMLGARQGEMLGLQRDLVDLETGTLDISWQLQSISYVHGCDPPCGRPRAVSCPDRTFEFGPDVEYEQVDGALHLIRPKNKKRRVVPIPAYLLAWLRRHYEESPESRFVWSRGDGRPLSPRADHARWKQILAEAGVDAVPLHSGRHTTASLLLALGVPERVIMQILGHSVIATVRRYAHVDLALARSAMDKLGEALALDAAVTSDRVDHSP